MGIKEPSGTEGYGLVLSGGLFRAAFQVGVIEALHARGFRPRVVVGVSAGAWNGACLAAGDVSRMREFWLAVADMPKVSLRRVFQNGTIFNLRTIFREIPERHLDFTQISRGAVDLRVGVTRLWGLRPRVFACHGKEPREIKALLHASNLIPGLFAWPVRVDGAYYIDGGFADNAPYSVAFAAGCARVLVVVQDPRGRVLKRLFDRRGHRPLPEYRERLAVVAPREPFPGLCLGRRDIETAIAEGHRVGQEVAF